MWDKKLEKRKLVRDRYLLPKLYKLDYQIDQIKLNQKQLVEKGRRKIYITADVVVTSKDSPAMVIAVRSGTEGLTDYIKRQTLSYARLLSPIAPIVVITNGLELKVYDTCSGEELANIPRQEELADLMIEKNTITKQMRETALDNVFSSVSLWDATERKSPYHTKSLRPYDSQDKGNAFNKRIFHNFNYKPNIVTRGDAVSIRVSSYRKLVDKIYVYYTTDGTIPQGKNGIAENGHKIELDYKYTEATPGQSQLIDWWSGKIPAQGQDGRVRYIIEGYDSKAEESYFADGAEDLREATRFSYLVEEFTTPDWAQEAIVYQIMVDRFCDGDPSNNYDLSYEATGYQGGDLQGIINKLNYIKDLGVTAIWLSPIYQGQGYHGYHITNFSEVDPHFGDRELLQELIERAHELDLKVILDFVPNHTSDQHPFFLDAIADKNSPYYDWYDFHDWPDKYQRFCGVDELPSFNTDNTQAREHIYEQALHWLLDYNLDGLRLDYAYGPSHDFWTEFRKVIKSHKPEAYIFGEVWESPGEIKQFEGELDGCFDFSLVWSFWELFAYESKTISDFVADLNYLNEYYDDDFIINRFLDNHDMDRFLWEADENKDKLKLAATCQFTLAGAQFIYYGTEVGLSQQEPCSDDNTGRIVFDNSRDFMLWGAEQDRELYSFYQKLCQIRTEHKVLATGERKDLIIDDQRKIWVYSKYDQQEEV
ncbi:MAG: alpha-amylase family glycosyl hydrolase, partial [Bacillota bacterium]